MQLPSPQNEKPSVTLCVMAYRDVEPEFMDCLIRDVLPLAQKYNLNYRRASNDALVQRSRSKAATAFLESDDDVMIMIDHDITWTGGRPLTPDADCNDIDRMIMSCLKTKGVVGGVVAKRGFGKGIACRFTEAREFTTGTDELIPCLYVGAAFVAIHRDVLQKLVDVCPRAGYSPVDSYWPFFATEIRPVSDNPDRVEELSEDWALCARVKDLGLPIHVDTKPILGHKGLHIYTIPDAFDKDR